MADQTDFSQGASAQRSQEHPLASGETEAGHPHPLQLRVTGNPAQLCRGRNIRRPGAIITDARGSWKVSEAGQPAPLHFTGVEGGLRLKSTMPGVPGCTWAVASSRLSSTTPSHHQPMPGAQSQWWWPRAGPRGPSEFQECSPWARPGQPVPQGVGAGELWEKAPKKHHPPDFFFQLPQQAGLLPADPSSQA